MTDLEFQKDFKLGDVLLIILIPQGWTMTLVDYETKVYNTYIIKEDTGFTDEEKLKAAYSGILGY